MTTLDPRISTLPQLSRAVLASFNSVRSETFAGHTWKKQFELLSKTICSSIVSRSIDDINPASGQGGWGELAWIGFRLNDLAPTWNSGLYVVLFYAADGKSLVLSLQQGIGELVEALGLSAARNELERRGHNLRAALPAQSRFTDLSIKLHAKYPPRGPMYERAHVFGKAYYEDDSLASLEDDLRSIVDYYERLRAVDIAGGVQYDLSYLSSLNVASSGPLTLSRKLRLLIDRLSREVIRNIEPIDCEDYFPDSTTRLLIGKMLLRKVLTQIYDEKCAACDSSSGYRRASNFTSLLQAAFVGADDEHRGARVGNSILLCPNHLWALEHYLWTVSHDMTIEVLESIVGLPEMAGLKGRRVPKPSEPRLSLSADAVATHRAMFQHLNKC